MQTTASPTATPAQQTPFPAVQNPSTQSPILAAIAIAEQLGQSPEVLTSPNCRSLISSLQMQQTESMRKLYQLMDDNQRLQEQINRFQLAPEVQLKNGHYYTENDGPFCTACFDTKRQLVRLSQLPEKLTDMANFLCNVCNAQYV